MQLLRESNDVPVRLLGDGVKLDLDRRTAKIESAGPLPPELQAKVQADLARAYGPGLALSFAQNPALIGGMRPWVTNEYEHNGLRADGERILGRLIDLARGRA